MEKPDSGMKVLDPRELIFESYRIEGITQSDCRTIFLDWALGWPVDEETRPKVAQMLDHYGKDAPNHPMTGVLRAALETGPKAKRRGGWRARRDALDKPG